MVYIKNANSYNKSFGPDDLYIFAIGYEQRSYYLYEEAIKCNSQIKPLLFVLDDYEKYDHVKHKVLEIQNRGDEFCLKKYEDGVAVQQTIIDEIKRLITVREQITVHIDYSSMPRSWYCKLPVLLKDIIRDDDKVFFWYVEGEYPSSYEEYPSAGIEAFSFFSGKPSLEVEKNRIHVIALGYDTIRTEAILSITDPSCFVACYAYNPKREGFSDSLKKVNAPVISRASMSLALHMNDFSFMVSKLCETANELLPVGDVVLIPDGPKPLIFALSLVPDLIGKNGVTCLHISRNNNSFVPVNVISTNQVQGFFIKKDPQK